MKPKLTKAEKAKLKQLEEERRLREEEEARIQAEREEQERLERQRKQEILDRLEAMDLERRAGELEELRSVLEKNHTAVIQHKNDVAAKSKWEKYMQCSNIPDPAVQQDINTFISLWRDDPNCNIPSVLQQCNVALQLIEELEELLKNAVSLKEFLMYQESLLHLQEMVYSKIVDMTAEILKGASANIDTETGNMQAVIKDGNLTMCLWANLMRNHRFKCLNFEEVGMGFELTKQLAASNITVRILHTRYDHLSTLSRMTHMKMTLPSFKSPTTVQEVPPEQEEAKEDKEEVPEEDADAQQQQETLEDEETPAQESETAKNSESYMSRSSNPHPDDGDSMIQTQIEKLAGKIDTFLIQKPSLLLTIFYFPADPIPSPLDESTEDANGDRHVVDLIQYTPLGGVFYYELFQLPPQAHVVKGWEIQMHSDTGLETFEYTIEKPSPTEEEDATSPLVGLSVTLPDTVIFLETPQVGRWAAAEKQWRTDGISDFSYNEEEAKISFKMESFYPFVLMQQTYANFPFQSWELRPLGQDTALFTINGALMDVNITIKGNQCMLQSERVVGLASLFEQWMSGPDLQQAMLKAGINVFVNEHTDKFVNTCDKDPRTEHIAYEQMSLFASVCAFSWSKWNAQCGAEHVIMKGCEYQGPDRVPDGLWSLYFLGTQRFQKLEITEASEVFSTDHHPDSEFHSTFIHMLKDNVSTEGLSRSRESSFLFVDTVQSMLCATRPLTFC
uniref:dynein axonemal intermediate chain 7 isoform X2 n=1 Tax=Doryrhamphus excisus TaxID=161450 RepID=UPI0025AE19D3|nr:dynein axonemal intermediate chain 7 isoform X2 [Doryrhamphus excisus]XP_057933336.1 dynein axonemal intermediate chain 7 isoform X2 [Doryrhamphus excisus]